MKEREKSPFAGKKILTIDDVADILLKDIRTINSYAEKGIISKPITDTSIISFDAQTLAEKLGVVDFSEPFIKKEDAEIILGLKKGILTNSYCKKLAIPFYSLSSKESGLRGTRLLFRKSELETYQQKHTIKIEVDTLWIENVARNQMVVMLYEHFDLLMRLINPHFTEREQFVLKMYLQGHHLQSISDSIKLTPESVRLILVKAKKVSHARMKRFVDWYQEICTSEKYKGMSPRNIIMDFESSKEKIRQLETIIYNLEHPNNPVVFEDNTDIEKILSIELKELDLSVRAFNCLEYKGVETLGELVTFSYTNLSKFRNLGKKTLKELSDLLHQKGFRWTDPDKPAEFTGIKHD